MIKLHWQFIAAKEKVGINFNEVSEVIVLHYDREEEALIAAKRIIERPVWHLKQVWECQNCQDQEKHSRFIDKATKLVNKLNSNEI